MQFIDGLTERWPGCKALLQDSGGDAPVVPACMGAISIEGAQSSLVGCIDYKNCVPRTTELPGFRRVFHRNPDTGHVIGESVVPIGIDRPIENNDRD